MNMQCPVCCQFISPQYFFSIAHCEHKYCQNCVLHHIKTKLQLFQPVYCPSGNCKQRLIPQSYIFNQLSKIQQRRFYKLQQFILIQTNTKFKPCQMQNCLGVLDTSLVMPKQQNYIECQNCHTQHCPLCYDFAHNNNTSCPHKQLNSNLNKNIKSQEEKMMIGLHYRKCPNCSMWVERNGGCQYLICKCKVQFCYNCGQLFQNDPCRKTNFEAEETQLIRLSRLSMLFKIPQKSFLQLILYLSKLAVKCILVLFFTVVGGMTLMFALFGLLIAVLYFVSPAGVFIMLGDSQIQNSTRAILRILTVILYPLVGLCVALGTFFIMATYPLMRLIFATHLYDEMDGFVRYISTIYLRGFHCIFEL